MCVEHALLHTNIVLLEVHLESPTWDCSEEGWKPMPVTQTGAGGIVTNLPKSQKINVL